MSDDIISFSKKSSEIKGHSLSNKKIPFNRCEHRSVLADDHNKVIECRKCRYIMTPWEYILRISNREDRILYNLKYARIEHNQINEELIELKKDVKNFKAQLKRTVEKIGVKAAELNKLNRK